MKRLKKWVAAAVFAASALCLSTSAFAGCADGSCGVNNNNNENGNYNDACCDSSRWVIAADLLFLNAYQELPYYSTTTTTAAAQTTTFSGAEYDWDLGFRLNGYYHSNCNGWDANVALTWFSTDVTETVADASAGTIFLRQTVAAPTTAPASNGVYTFTNNLDYWAVDALVGHTCCVCPGFTLRPYAGFKAVSVEQDSSQAWASASQGINTHSIDFKGYGMTGGVESKFVPCTCFCDDLYVWGKVGGSVVGGSLDHTIVNRDTNSLASTSTVLDSKSHTSFGYELGLGVAYDYCFCDKWWSFGVGYEVTHWTDVGNPIVVSDDSLTLHGVTLRGTVTF